MIYVFAGFWLFFIVCIITIQMMIASYLSKRGDRVTLWQIRFHMLSYLKQYREATIKEHGKTGPLFYALITTLVLMVVFLIIVLILLLT